MSLKYGLLGFLTYQPRTGYELHKLYVKPMRPTIAYIYRALTEMAKKGLVKAVHVDQEKRPARNVFEITDAGLVELDKWLGTPLPFMLPRNTLIVQVWFGSRIGKDKLAANVTAYRDEGKAILEVLKDRKQWAIVSTGKLPGRDVNSRYRILAYSSAIDLLERQIDWLDSIIAKLGQFENGLGTGQVE